jgi:hypothetical protein
MKPSPSRLLFAVAACAIASMLPKDGALALYPERIVKIVVPSRRAAARIPWRERSARKWRRISDSP